MTAPTTTPDKALRRAAAKHAAARAALDQEIRTARDAGMPLRAIATATGLSPEWVRRIVAGTATKAA
jgi:hypothetical protein